MLNIKSLDVCCLLTVGFLAVSGCSLPAPKHSAGDGGTTNNFMCLDDVDGGPDGGMDDGSDGSADSSDDSSVDAGSGNGINNVITPVSCTGTNANPFGLTFAYTPGYTPDPKIVARVDMVLSTNALTLSEEAAQMRGLAITPFYAPTNNIERSEDTSSIRGFRYRDASRGMDLGEDFSGTYPKAGKEPGGSDVGYSTAFPVSMARGAAFDLDLEYAIGEAIGDEMQAAKETLLLAPCMNLLRHPFWGRAQETYSEDSFHIGRLATAMVVGIQQHIAANAKHFMAYNVENNRPKNNAVIPDEQTLREIFGRHFRMVVQDSGVASVMASYNLINGKKATQNSHILTDVLRNDFGFKGFILSDWWAMPNTDPKEVDATTLKLTAVEAVKAGLDVELPWGLNYGQLENIVNTQGGLTKDDIDRSVRRVLEQKFRFNADPLSGNVGLPPGSRTYYSGGRISCDGTHIALAEKAALESMVLLKNANNTLPIKGATKVAVVGATVEFKVTDGATAAGTRTLNFAKDVITGDLGSSRVFHDPDKGVGPFAGVCMAAGGSVNPTTGACDSSSGITVTTATTVLKGTTVDTTAVSSAVADADFIVVVAGMTPEDEGEEYTKAGDRQSFALDAKQYKERSWYTGIQEKVIDIAQKTGKPMVVVLEGGSVISVQNFLGNVPALVMAWYPGERGGQALGKLLFGQVGGKSYNFSGKLPFTWSNSPDDYGTFYDSKNSIAPHEYFVGYRRFDQQHITPLFPFGHGLSYTSFEYRKLQLGCSDMGKGAMLPVVVNVANTGTVAGDETVMVFVSFPQTTARRSIKELKGFARVHLAAGEEKQITIPVRLADLDYFKMDSAQGTTGKWVVETGPATIMVGGSSASLPLTGTVQVAGY